MSHPQWGITVLMTTHERPHLLRRALRSVLEQEQTDLPVHIVLVSDAGRCCINQFQGELPQTQPWLCHGRRLRTAQFCKSI